MATLLDEDLVDLEPCSGGCGDLVVPNAIGIASCGEIDCARQAAAYDRADQMGARV